MTASAVGAELARQRFLGEEMGRRLFLGDETMMAGSLMDGAVDDREARLRRYEARHFCSCARLASMTACTACFGSASRTFTSPS